jgi:hypothetical protein
MRPHTLARHGSTRALLRGLSAEELGGAERGAAGRVGGRIDCRRRQGPQKALLLLLLLLV